MLLSVIVIAYNEEKYIRECLDSILCQTYKDFELIIVDDGSTDATGVICDEYAAKDNRIRVLHQANSGMSRARYAGFLQTKGDYVTFVDADDKIVPEAYEKALAHLSDNIDMIAYGIIYWQPDTGEIRGLQDDFLPGVYDQKRLSQEVYPSMIWNCSKNKHDLLPNIFAKIIRREILDKVMNSTKDVCVNFAEDFLRTVMAMRYVNKMIILPICLIYYRLRSKGTLPSYLQSNNYFRDLFEVYSNLTPELDYHPSLRKQLDYFFMQNIQAKKIVYENFESSNRTANFKTYLFPFTPVNKNGNIILYGAGTVGKTFFNQIQRTSYCNVILWVDRNYENCKNDLFTISPVEEILSSNYDQIVICLANDIRRKNIAEDLVKMGIDKKKIIYEYKCSL